MYPSTCGGTIRTPCVLVTTRGPQAGLGVDVTELLALMPEPQQSNVLRLDVSLDSSPDWLSNALGLSSGPPLTERAAQERGTGV